MRTALLCLSLLIGVFAAGARAQVCHVENDGPLFTDNSSAGPPSVSFAVRFTPVHSFTATAVDVFTGEQTGTNGVAIWSHNGFSDEPNAPLGAGSWEVGATNQWQGASLWPTVPLNSGATYWMVWTTVANAQMSIQSGVGLGQVYHGSQDGGATWTGPFQTAAHWKFRIECCPGFFEPYATGCSGTFGVPVLAGFGCPSPGNTITIKHSGMLPAAPGLLLIGTNNVGTPLNPSCWVWNLPWVGGGTPFTVGPLGTLNLPGTIPLGTVTPVDVYVQTLISDNGVPGGIASTNPLRIHIE